MKTLLLMLMSILIVSSCDNSDKLGDVLTIEKKFDSSKKVEQFSYKVRFIDKNKDGTFDILKGKIKQIDIFEIEDGIDKTVENVPVTSGLKLYRQLNYFENNKSKKGIPKALLNKNIELKEMVYKEISFCTELLSKLSKIA